MSWTIAGYDWKAYLNTSNEQTERAFNKSCTYKRADAGKIAAILSGQAGCNPPNLVRP
jgi:hypothetical protein